MSVRAKFVVSEVTAFGSQGQTSHYKKVKLTAVFDDGIPENARFAKASPSGTLEIGIDNPPAADFFTPGKLVYLDFTEA